MPMPYCPNCNAELQQGGDAEQVCWNCDALLGGDSAWKPLAAPTGPFQRHSKPALSQAQQVPSPSLGPTSYQVLNRAMLLFLWAGHFFSVGVTVLFVLYHWLLYKGGGTSGVGLAFSWMFSVLLYGIAFVFFLFRNFAPNADRAEINGERQNES